MPRRKTTLRNLKYLLEWRQTSCAIFHLKHTFFRVCGTVFESPFGPLLENSSIILNYYKMYDVFHGSPHVACVCSLAHFRNSAHIVLTVNKPASGVGCRALFNQMVIVTSATVYIIGQLIRHIGRCHLSSAALGVDTTNRR